MIKLQKDQGAVMNSNQEYQDNSGSLRKTNSLVNLDNLINRDSIIANNFSPASEANQGHQRYSLMDKKKLKWDQDLSEKSRDNY